MGHPEWQAAVGRSGRREGRGEEARVCGGIWGKGGNVERKLGKGKTHEGDGEERMEEKVKTKPQRGRTEQGPPCPS